MKMRLSKMGNLFVDVKIGNFKKKNNFFPLSQLNWGMFTALAPTCFCYFHSRESVAYSAHFQVPIFEPVLQATERSSDSSRWKRNLLEAFSVVHIMKGNTKNQVWGRKGSKKLQDLSKEHIFFL